MKRSIAVAIFLATSIFTVHADEPSLRVGHAQTPGEAKAELESLKESYPDLTDWKKRKKKLVAGIFGRSAADDFTGNDALEAAGFQTSGLIRAILLRVWPLRVLRDSL